MKSRISIDVDYNNQPIIKIEYNESDDVRDKLVKRFLEGFGGDSKWAGFKFIGHQNSGSISEITPIKMESLEEESKAMKAGYDLAFNIQKPLVYGTCFAKNTQIDIINND